MTRAIFKGYDATQHPGLWVTDGTSAGTSELTVAGASSSGLLSFSFALTEQFKALGSNTLFAGTDASNAINLWETDGTSAGTRELAVAGANSRGLFFGIDPDLAVLGSEALFAGLDASFHDNLWVTNGTSAGTSELTVAGARPSSLTARGLTVFGTRALFAGTDVRGVRGLWVSDGTAQGTSELTVIGSDSRGLFTSGAPEFAILGTKAVFAGSDASQKYNLWVTDGTSAGTSELTVAGADSSGLFDGARLSTSDFIVFGGKALFDGRDASGSNGLWVTDGTSAGTIELRAGLFSTGVSPGFTVLGSKLLFESGSNLWVTDGTPTGTSELAVAGADSRGLLASFDTPAFAVIAGRALFAGDAASPNANFNVRLWVTDGTLAGTSELPAPGAAPIDITAFGAEALFNSGANLWVTDGTSAGTSELPVAGASSSGLSPSDITVHAYSLWAQGWRSPDDALFGGLPDRRCGAATADREFEQVCRELIEVGKDFGRWEDVGVFGVHVAQADGVAGFAPVEAALLRQDHPII